MFPNQDLPGGRSPSGNEGTTAAGERWQPAAAPAALLSQLAAALPGGANSAAPSLQVGMQPDLKHLLIHEPDFSVGGSVVRAGGCACSPFIWQAQ